MDSFSAPVSSELREVTFANRSPFQMAFARAVSERPSFRFFCGDWGLEEDSTYRGPFALVWYEEDGLHAVWLGMIRVLHGGRELIPGGEVKTMLPRARVKTR